MNANKHENFLVVLSLILVGISVLPLGGQAAEFYFGAHGPDVDIDKQFEVGVFLNTDRQPLNAVEGMAVFPAENLELRGIQDGDSIIPLWIKAPKSTLPGKVEFSGVLPGGYQGNRGYLFSLIFKPRSLGEVTITTEGERALRNDGTGSETEVRRAPLVLQVKEQAQVEEFLLPNDPDPPEAFGPKIAKDPSLYEGKWFVVFATQDKISGIDYYAIHESPRKKTQVNMNEWIKGEGPYLLEDQGLRSYIYVKAVDRAGNERIETLRPQNQTKWYEKYGIWVIIIGIAALVGVIGRKLWRKKYTKHRE